MLLVGWYQCAQSPYAFGVVQLIGRPPGLPCPHRHTIAIPPFPGHLELVTLRAGDSEFTFPGKFDAGHLPCRVLVDSPHDNMPRPVATLHITQKHSSCVWISHHRVQQLNIRIRIEVHEEGGIAVLVNLVAPGLRETPFSLLQRTHQSSARDRIVSPGNYRNTSIRIETTYAICPDPVSRLDRKSVG